MKTKCIEADTLKRAQIDKWNDIAEKSWGQHNYKESIKNAEKALRLSKEISYEKGIADSSRNLGTVYSIQSRNNLAIESLQLALSIYKKNNDSLGIIKSDTNLGIVHGNIGKYSESLDYFYEAIEFCEKNNLEKLLAEQYVNVGSVFRKLQNTVKAYEYYKKSYKIKKSIGDEQGLASIYNNIANLYRKTDVSLSLGYFKKALKIWEKYSFKRGMAIVLNNISKILIEKDKFDEAIEYIEKQLNISIELDLNMTLCLGFIHLAEIYIIKEEFLIVEDYLQNAYQIIEIIDDKELLITYKSMKIKQCLAQFDYKSAFNYSQEIGFIKDELHDQKISEKIAEVETNYKLREKEQEKELYRVKNVELVDAFNEIEKQKEQLSIINEKLILMDRSKDNILRVVSHDLKNLIGSIASVIDLIRFDPLPEKTENYVSIIDQSTQKALQLLKDLLEANTIEMQDFELDLFPSNLTEVMKSIEGSFKVASQLKNINFTIKYPINDIKLLLDIDRFWQIISNLVFNSIKFTDKNGSITISIESSAKICHIYIQDTGIGIEKSMIPHIFDKFTKAKRKGTDGEITFGLGLSIVKRLVGLHKGKIRVESEVNQGTTFILSFPIYQ